MRIAKRAWGDVDGAPVWLFEIEGNGLRAEVSNYGGVLRALELTEGPGLDVVLGYDTLVEYRKSDTFFGATVGPIADRMAEGRCVLDGRKVQLPLNAGPDSMHCADRGFHRALWRWEPLADGVRLFRDFDGAETGFPGVLSASVCYRVPSPGMLRLEYAAECTRETAVSFTNHSYFNLTGGKRDCREHVLTLNAGRYAETWRMVEPIATGRALPVAGTPLDFRDGMRVGDALAHDAFPEIAAAGGVDHYFLAEGEGLREAARLTCPETGLAMVCRTDAPGLLVYTGNGLEAERGKAGRIYGKNWGVCLETERFPNAVNFPERRDQVMLEPGERYRTVTEFEFGRVNRE